MRIQSLGNKLRTGVLGVALLHAPVSLTKAAKTLGTEANSLGRSFTESGFSKSQIADKSVAYLEDLVDQSVDKIKFSAKNEVKSGKIQDEVIQKNNKNSPVLSKTNIVNVLADKLNLPVGVKYISENADYKKFELDKTALYKLNSKVDTANMEKAELVQPKKNSGYSANDYAIKVDYKPFRYDSPNGSGFESFVRHRQTLLRDQHSTVMLDSIVAENKNVNYTKTSVSEYLPSKQYCAASKSTIVPKSPTSEFAAGFTDYTISGSDMETQLVDKKTVEQYKAIFKSKYDFYSGVKSSKIPDEVIQTNNKISPVLIKNNIVNVLSDKLNLPKGVKYISENDDCKKFELDKSALYKLNSKVDTANVEKAELVQPKGTSGYSVNDYAIRVDYKPFKFAPSPGFENVVRHRQTLVRDQHPTVMLDSIVAENKKVNYIETAVSEYLPSKQYSTVSESRLIPKPGASSDASTTIDHTISGTGRESKSVDKKTFEQYKAIFKSTYDYYFKK